MSMDYPEDVNPNHYEGIAEAKDLHLPRCNHNGVVSIPPCVECYDLLSRRVEKYELELGEAGAMSAAQDNALVSLRKQLTVAKEALRKCAKENLALIPGSTTWDVCMIAREALKEIEK